MKARLKKTLENTKFKDSPMIEVTANPNAGNPVNNDNSEPINNNATHPEGIENLHRVLLDTLELPKRDRYLIHREHFRYRV